MPLFDIRGGSAKKAVVLIFFTAFSAATIFALYTEHAWEDYYITFRVSKNLATGHGLVYTPGEKVHTFTSPLGVLIPAAISAATGNRSDPLVLWLFRIVSSAAFGAAAVLLFQIGRAEKLRSAATVMLIAMFGLDAKTVDFTINGMETGLMMVFLALILKTLIVPSKNPVLMLGVAWAALMWTRPDSFVYITALCVGFLLFHNGSPLGGSRGERFRVFVKAGILAAIFYLPWFVWAWTYYGSPIPHTVIAKGLTHKIRLVDMLVGLPLYPAVSLVSGRALPAMFLPPYAAGGDWPFWAQPCSMLIAWLCAFYWIYTRGHALVRSLSFAFMLGSFYLDRISPFPYPWYLPNCTILAFLMLAVAFDRWAKKWSGPGEPGPVLPKIAAYRLLVRALPVAAISVALFLTMCAAHQLRVRQQVIEDGNRKKIGLWLASNAASKTDTVFLEPLGYIGHYSQLKMLDFPGLSSPEVVAARRRLGMDSAAQLVRELNPDWLVLRPWEEASIQGKDPQLLSGKYQKARVFDVSEQVDSYRWLPGRNYLAVDRIYTVYRRSR